MKTIKIILIAVLGLVLLTAGFLAWFCTGSFTYQLSMNEKFVIDAPISVVCKRAMNIKSKPQTKGKLTPKIDMQEAAMNYSLGKPIELELDHPKLGIIKAEIKINLEAEPNSLQIHGKVVSLEPSRFEKYGKALADVENIAFTLKVATTDESGSNGGFLQFFSETGKTVIEMGIDSSVCVHFREMGLLNSLLRRKVGKVQQKMHEQIMNFVDENLSKPTKEELAEQKAREEKATEKQPKKKGMFWNRLLQGVQEKTLEVIEEELTEEEEKEEKEKKVKKVKTEDEEEIDVSALDEEI